MLWEFKHDYTEAKRVEIKYYALDEILGFVGGNMNIVMCIVRMFMIPYSLNKFVVTNSSKKEEIEM